MTQKENANLPPEIKRWGVIALGRKSVMNQYPLVRAKQHNPLGGAVITTLRKEEILPNTIVNQIERHIASLEPQF